MRRSVSLDCSGTNDWNGGMTTEFSFTYIHCFGEKVSDNLKTGGNISSDSLVHAFGLNLEGVDDF